MEAIFGFINAVTGWIWGIPILVLLVGGGLILTVVIGGDRKSTRLNSSH